MNDDLMNRIAEEAKLWRHEPHKNPQTMYKETFASELVARKLSEWGIPLKKESRRLASWRVSRDGVLIQLEP
jgi:metal-dependent amidase/aminoacylase/carboxypeptidase family protein